MEDNLNYTKIFTEKVVDVPNLHVFQGLSIFIGGKKQAQFSIYSTT